ncbi:hypothetical protein DCAR_0209013 [Daucus carota subsp. sativus]|uniref:Glutamate receptor n=2 Tax=Daucus carota subsp. sativus TaxID=79200 RepID=A0AAF1ANL0_DAUCS|nr:hypothetical protein DCAR_0209013 [Daucus carota subsp. sativus]
MSFLIGTFSGPLKLGSIFFPSVVTIFLLLLSDTSIIISAHSEISIGSIINVKTRVGKEIVVAMKVAAHNFNNSSMHQTLYLHFRDSSGNPLQAAYTAEELLKENVQAIIGMETWEQAALVADVANKAEVPVVSFSSAAIKKPFASLLWPFLLQMNTNINEQIRCIAAIVHSFNWHRVIPIYEADVYGGDSGIYAALTEALQRFGVDIEYHLVLPPSSLLSDESKFIQEEVAKLLSKQSRVFIVLQASVSMAIGLFKEAKEVGLVGKDSVWIMTEGITSLLDSFDTSVISSMEGALGIKTYISEDNSPFVQFRHQFRKLFRSEYPEEDYSDVGIYALRAHDSIVFLTRAINRLRSSNNTSKALLETILKSKFSGLSGDFHFNSGELSQDSVFRIVNVVGRRYKELGFWSKKFGFSSSLVHKESTDKSIGSSMEVLANLIYWPGNLKRTPKGWCMPTEAKPMKFAVPGETSFKKFVKVQWSESSKEINYSGFCIDVFFEVLKILEESYSPPYEFVPYNGTYDNLVDHVADKTFDAVIGDVTILANRSKYVEFTQPFAESGLTMIVPVKPQADKAWMFLKPFSKGMWGMTAAILVYTVLIVWLLERRSNPEFDGPWHYQLSTALWFTSSSLFFAQREQIYNNHARVAVSVWLFVVLALSSSYTATLSSMLTAPRLEANVTDIGWLKKNNAIVGCDGSSFVKRYLENVLGFNPVNIRNISSEYNYPEEFESGRITAAFLEVPYEKAFLNHHCQGYTVAGSSGRYGGDRFGGLGFVFQKGSPIAADASQAILTLLENGRLKQLEIEWFAPTSDCLTTQSHEKTESLTWHSFWGLYLLSVGTSSLCYLVFVSHQLYEHLHEAYRNLRTKIVNMTLLFMIALEKTLSLQNPWV